MPKKKSPDLPIQPLLFNENGYLPHGMHHLNLPSIEFHLVKQAAPSRTRAKIFTGYMELRACFETIGANAVQWLDGSFTTTKADPGDINLVSFCDASQIDKLPDAQFKLLTAYTSGKITKALCHCDSYIALNVPEHHPLREDFETTYNYWLDLFGNDRTGTPKGIVTTETVAATAKENDSKATTITA